MSGYGRQVKGCCPLHGKEQELEISEGEGIYRKIREDKKRRVKIRKDKRRL